jgi:hypothetical protein
MGPKRQWKNMMKPTRMVVSLILLASMIATLLNAFVFKSRILTIVFLCVQVCALVWYTLSYIPGGRMCCKKLMKSLCCGDDEEKGESMI